MDTVRSRKATVCQSVSPVVAVRTGSRCPVYSLDVFLAFTIPAYLVIVHCRPPSVKVYPLSPQKCTGLVRGFVVSPMLLDPFTVHCLHQDFIPSHHCSASFHSQNAPSKYSSSVLFFVPFMRLSAVQPQTVEGPGFLLSPASVFITEFL